MSGESRYVRTSGGRVLVGLSGGFESAVAAALLKTQGFDVVGVHVRLCSSEQRGGLEGFRCCRQSDAAAAKRFCEAKDIPFHEVDASTRFESSVADFFVHERLQARSPNPCARCIEDVIFTTLYEEAEKRRCEKVATGHYAQISVEAQGGRARLYRAVESAVDQSFYLHWLNPEFLRKTMFPLGGVTSRMVGKLAEELELPFKRPSGHEPLGRKICMDRSPSAAAFVEKRVAPSLLGKDGVVRTTDGGIVGEHDGLYRHWIGERKLSDLKSPEQEKLAVIDADPVHNALIVGADGYLSARTRLLTEMRWLNAMDGLHELECEVQMGPAEEPRPCRVMNFENDTARIEFEEPVAVTGPGRVVVLYRQNEVLGGGKVSRHGPEPGILVTPGSRAGKSGPAAAAEAEGGQ